MLTPQKAVDQFLASLRSRQAPANTFRSYAHDLQHFVQVVPSTLEEATTHRIQTFLDSDGHHSPATRAHRYATLCTFYRWALRLGFI